MNYQIDYRSFNGIFAVPTQVKPLLTSCSNLALRLLLLILSQPEEPIRSASLSAALGCPPADIEQALDYWCRQGILSAGMEAVKPAPELSEKPKVRRVTTRKTMTNLEMEQLYRSDPNISSLIQQAEGMLGRPLSSPEIETLCSFYTYDDLSPEYLLLVLMYCIRLEKTNFGYFKKVVSNMLEQDIDSYDKAELYLHNYMNRKQNENLVRSAFGIHDRKLSQKESDCIAQWFGEFAFDISVIRLAYEECVNSTGKLSFPYIHKILSNWNGKGIRSSKEASLETSAQKKQLQQSGSMASSFDMNEIQQLLEQGFHQH